MSTAIAMAPSPAPHDRHPAPADISAKPTTSPTAQRTARSPLSSTASLHSSAPEPTQQPQQQQQQQQQRSGSGSPRGPPPPTAKSSPPSASASRNAGPPPKIIVKKEPASPEPPTARHRPRKLDLSKNTISTTGNTPSTARPLTARDGLGIQEAAVACLSPGFVTQDPVMKEQLQRSLSVREHQRQIIESRLLQQSAKGDGPGGESSKDRDMFAAKTPGMSRRNRAPPGLSIVAPSHEQFANERVIQSAPLGHSFTGRHNPHPLTRHLTNQPSNLSSTSHIHHVPANQSNNRLPPIADVLSRPPESREHPMYAPSRDLPRDPRDNHRPLSPGHPPPPPPPQMPTPGRPREFRTAEEAQAELAGGRSDLLPNASNNSTAKRRRAEYEDGHASPPLGNGRPAQRTRQGPFGEGRDSPDTSRRKREEFLHICERLWDLFHS